MLPARKFIGLTREQRRLVCLAALLVGAFRLGLRLFPFRTVLRALARLPRGERPAPADASAFRRDSVWAVKAAGRRLLGDRPCLPEALALLVLWKRHGLPAVLRIGVQKGGSGAFRAHAWVEAEGDIVLGRPAPAAQYVPLPPIR